MSNRLAGLGVAFALLWVILIVRVAYIQVLQASHYREIAQGQSVARDVLPPARGEVFDREGTRLVVNVPGRDGASRGGSRLAPNGPLAGQVIGMIGRDGYGQSGLELFLDADLRGTDGWRYTRRDVKRRYAPGASDQIHPPVDGLGVRLTLDARVQSVAELALERGVLRTGAKSGVVVVLDPRTGDILALANYPFFDPNAKRAQGAENWRNNAVAMVYEPGSTFKVFTAAALLEEGRIHANDTIDAEGGRWQIGGQWIRDTHAMDRVSFAEAVAHSSNIVFAKVSTRITQVAFYKYLRSFGFGMKTGVSLPAEESGLLKPVENWSGRTQQTIAFGHEVSVTPLQLAMAFGAIANGGVLMRPRLVHSWVDGEGRVVRGENVREVRRVLSPRSAAALREMMAGVVDHGTAKDIKHPFITIAGKTGSAQKIDPETGRYIEGRYNASFAGMAPADKPAFVCVVVVDDPRQFKYGGQAAGPIFREILDRLAERGIGGDWMPPPEIIATAPKNRGTNIGTNTPAESGTRTKGTGSAMIAAAEYHRPGTHSGKGMENGIKATQDRGVGTRSAVALDRNEMPDLREATLRDALVRLRALGVEVEYTGEGRVTEQVPAPGTPLHKGARAQLKLGWAG
jgi:cell division protein FtsI/penicillin-binding protein 2